MEIVTGFVVVVKLIKEHKDMILKSIELLRKLAANGKWSKEQIEEIDAKIANQNAKLQKISKIVEDTELKQIQHLRDLEARAQAAQGDVEEQRKIARERAAAEAVLDEKRRELSKQVMDQIEEQKEINKNLLASMEESNKKLLQDSDDKMKDFFEKQKKQMQDLLDQQTNNTDKMIDDRLGKSGSKLLAMVQDQKMKIAQKYEGNFVPNIRPINTNVVNNANHLAGYLN